MGNLSDFLSPIAPASLQTQKLRRALPLHAGKSESSREVEFDWEQMIETACAIEDADELRVTSNRNHIPAHFLFDSGRVNRAKLEKLIDRGASILVHNAHRYNDRFRDLIKEVIDLTGNPAWLGAIGSTGGAGALTPHFDPYDIFVRQIAGTKRWRFLSSENDDAEIIAEHVLRAGDYLYVPAGEIHECDTISESSLHLGIGFAVPGYKVWADD